MRVRMLRLIFVLFSLVIFKLNACCILRVLPCFTFFLALFAVGFPYFVCIVLLTQRVFIPVPAAQSASSAVINGDASALESSVLASESHSQSEPPSQQLESVGAPSSSDQSGVISQHPDIPSTSGS